MAKKGTIKVDILKENPLLTILKNGKVPIVRIAKKGFQNYNQFRFFDEQIDWDNNRKDFRKICKKSVDDILNGERPSKGCFVQIGGIQGQFIEDCEFDFNESKKIFIGYLEPDEKIYITCTHKDSKLEPFSFVTAKERYLDSLNYFSSVYEEFKNKVDFDSFKDKCKELDIYSEAIVDSTKIKKVIELKNEELGYLLKYSNNRFLKILFSDDLIFRILNQGNLPKALADNFNLPLDIKEDKSDYYSFYDRLFYDSVFYNIVEQNFIDYYNNKSLKYNVKKYLEDFYKLDDKLNSLTLGIVTEYKCLTWKNNAVKLTASIKRLNYPFSRVSKFGLNSFGYFKLSTEDGFKFLWTKNSYLPERVTEEVNLSLNDCLHDEIRPIVYDFLCFYQTYVDFLTNYTKIDDTLEIRLLKECKDLETSIKKHLDGFRYSFNNEDKVLSIFLGEIITIEYNFILDDFAIRFNEDWYNFENIPEENYEVINFVDTLYFIIKKSDLYKDLKKGIFNKLFY